MTPRDGIAALKADTATVSDNSAEGRASALVAEKSEDTPRARTRRPRATRSDKVMPPERRLLDSDVEVVLFFSLCSTQLRGRVG